jgi:tetratricopeptide (TPR) repeat protein
MRRSLAIALFLFFPLGILAQMHEHDAPRAVTLEEGLGNEHFAVTTSSSEAQKFFDQGMRYVYAFNHEEAVRSFTHAGELDPNLAMAWWGSALALGPNINMDVDPDREKQAYDAVQTALTKSARSSEKERDLIDALAKRYTSDPSADLHKLGEDYSHAMSAVAKKYPDDPDINTLFAESMMDLRPWKFWSHDGKPAEGTEEIVRVLKGVLKEHPNHVGANHYLIHAVEASPNPADAVKSAERLKTLAPSAGHLVHMPAHIYQRTGNYSGAAQANVNGAVADRAYIKKAGNGGMYPTMYYNHNLAFGSVSFAMIGRYDEAKKLGDEFAANAVMLARDVPPVEGFVAWPAFLAARSGRWSDVLKMDMAGAGPMSSMFLAFARGVAHAAVGNILGAQSDLKELEKVRETLTDETGFLQSSQKSIGEVASHALAGRIALARGDMSGAVEHLRLAVEADDKLNYDEPPNWPWPTREMLGAALLKAGRNAEAEATFREDLIRNPHNPRSLYGLAQALRAQKKSAAKTEAEFKRMWQGPPLTMAQF